MRFEQLDDALNALEERSRELARSSPGDAVDLRYKRFEPAQRVLARLELAGPERLIPTVRAGVDVHGDGSTEPYRGRIKRTPVDQQKGEDAFAALRRVLTA